jgi:DnaJ homolog subfamily B member 6
MPNYYEILGVGNDAASSDIKKAYKKLAVRWHPDKNPDNQEEASSKFKMIAEAYETLRDATSRREYDLSLLSPHSDHGDVGVRGTRSGFSSARNSRMRNRGNFSEARPFDIFDAFFADFEDFHRGFQEEADMFFSGSSRMRGHRSVAQKLRRHGRENDDVSQMAPFGMFPSFGGGFGLRGMDMLSDMEHSFSQNGDFVSSSSFSSSSTSFGRDGRGRSTSKSVSSSTFTAPDGRRITRTETTFVHPDGRKETNVDEKVHKQKRIANRY